MTEPVCFNVSKTHGILNLHFNITSVSSFYILLFLLYVLIGCTALLDIFVYWRSTSALLLLLLLLSLLP